MSRTKTKRDERGIQKMALEICQKQGYYEGQTVETLDVGETEVIYRNAYDISLFSYQFWKNRISSFAIQNHLLKAENERLKGELLKKND
jgi:hypothetical protein